MEIIAIVLLAILLCLWIASGYFGGHKKYSVMSFKEALDLTDVPIVTFYEGDTKLNFLLDTGSSDSHISQTAAKILQKTPTKIGFSCTTAMGKTSGDVHQIDAILSYKGSDYPQTLIVTPTLDVAFEEIKKTSGVQLHGILGSDFFNKYNYVLDFKDMIAYVRK